MIGYQYSDEVPERVTPAQYGSALSSDGKNKTPMVCAQFLFSGLV